jgi:hypothetical protein
MRQEMIGMNQMAGIKGAADGYNMSIVYNLAEAFMRAAVLGLVAVFGLALAAPVQAAPVAPQGPVSAVAAPDVIFVAGGCGPGWHPRSWRDQWGRWHRRCVPNRW